MPGSMRTTSRHALALGLDFGTDSVRALVVDAQDGRTLGAGVAAYPAWARGELCDPARQRFRQRPGDHLRALGRAVRAALAAAGPGAGARIAGIGVDTTGSSPLPLAADGTALGLLPDFADDPDAQCILWKDHTAIAEAEALNALAHGAGALDVTRWVGGISSSEWWWAKIAHVHRHNARVARAAHTWMEHCDWIPFVLTGGGDPARAVRSRCAAGHKALWHPDWGGLPPEDWLVRFEPRLRGLRARLYEHTATADAVAGVLAPTWARTFGVPAGIPVAAGAFDCHLGAVGVGIRPGQLVQVMGTSTCAMAVAKPASLGQRTVPGICGQVDGSILPGLVGVEAGQSAFGDIFAWYRRLLGGDDELLPRLERAAADLPPGGDGLIATDWFNGRRTPDADQRLRATIHGLHLGSDPAALYRALIEAAACGARAIVDRFTDHGVAIRQVVAIGGIARKSPLVMQVCADVLGRPIAIAAEDQCCALGAAMAGAAAAGVHPSLAAASRAMASPIERTVRPRAAVVRAYRDVYARYRRLGAVEI
jgi:L-ribulokinase